MSDTGDENSSEPPYQILVASEAAQVLILNELKETYDELEEKTKGRLERAMQMWCENRKLTPEMFNGNEGRSSVHKILISAFKSFQARLYGYSKRIMEKRSFLITEIDPAKKKNKADSKILKRAQQRADDLHKG